MFLYFVCCFCFLFFVSFCFVLFCFVLFIIYIFVYKRNHKATTAIRDSVTALDHVDIPAAFRDGLGLSTELTVLAEATSTLIGEALFVLEAAGREPRYAKEVAPVVIVVTMVFCTLVVSAAVEVVIEKATSIPLIVESTLTEEMETLDVATWASTDMS